MTESNKRERRRVRVLRRNAVGRYELDGEEVLVLPAGMDPAELGVFAETAMSEEDALAATEQEG